MSRRPTMDSGHPHLLLSLAPFLCLALVTELARGQVAEPPGPGPTANDPAAATSGSGEESVDADANAPEPEADAEPELEPQTDAAPETSDEAAPSTTQAAASAPTEPAPDTSKGPVAPEPMQRTEPAPPGPATPSGEESSGQPATAPFPAPVQRPLRAEEPLDLEVDRRQVMPGPYVDRPLTAPRGTFAFSFELGSAFINTEPASATSPAFALGVTPDLELGVTAPLRYDQGILDWTAVEPIPHLRYTFAATDAWELGAGVSARIPTRVDTDPLLTLVVPGLLRANESLRLDAGIEAEFGFEEKTEVSLRVPLAATVQFTPWFFSRIRGALDLGVTSGRTTGLDAGLLAGVTHQTRGKANVDLTLELFVENIGGGRSDRLSDGGGLLVAARFFPELY